MLDSSIAPYLVLGVLLGLIVLLVQGRLRPGVLFGGALGLLYLLDLIELQPMLHNFVNPALVTLVLLILFSQVLERTQLIRRATEGILTGHYRWALAKLMLVTGALSAFLNNTALVAALMGHLQRHPRFPASRLLIPLSYAAILGGTMTLVGTSTNLIINSFVIDAGLPPLEMFDFLPIGLALLLAGTLYMVIVGPWLLPLREQEAIEPSRFFIEAVVEDDSPLIGKTLQANGLRNLKRLFLVELIRDGHLNTPVAPDEVIQAGDVLVFAGAVEDVGLIKQFGGLRLYDGQLDLLRSNLVEVVIAPSSNLPGQTIKSVNFRARFDAAVVAIRRGDEHLSGGLGKVRLRAGDHLVLAVGRDFAQRQNLDRNFHILNQLGLCGELGRKTSLAVSMAFAGVIAMAALNVLPLIDGMIILIAIALVMRWIRLDDLRRRFPHELVIIIGSSLGIAQVMLETGAANLIAQGVNSLFNGWGVLGALVSVYVLTWLLTEIITNNAAAALAFPVAYALANTYNVDPLPFIFAVAYAASMSFITPYGYQTNLMVSNAGGYRVTDFTRLGLGIGGLAMIIVVAGLT